MSRNGMPTGPDGKQISFSQLKAIAAKKVVEETEARSPSPALSVATSVSIDSPRSLSSPSPTVRSAFSPFAEPEETLFDKVSRLNMSEWGKLIRKIQGESFSWDLPLPAKPQTAKELDALLKMMNKEESKKFEAHFESQAASPKKPIARSATTAAHHKGHGIL